MGGHGDSIVAWDRATDRFSVYDRELTLQRTYSSQIPRDLAAGQVVRGLFSDGRVVRSTDESFVTRTETMGVHRPVLATYVHGPRGEIVATPGPFRGRQLSAHTSRRTGRTMLLPVPLGDRTIFGVGGDHLVVADTEVGDVRFYAGGEELTAVLRPNVEAAPATDSARAAEIDQLLEPLPNDDLRERMRPEFESLASPTELPWITTLIVDAQGRAWARLTTSGGVWAVFDPAAGWLANVVVPEGEILEIGRDYIVLLERNALGVESVALHRIRGGSG